MTVEKLRGDGAPGPERAGNIAVLSRRRERLAIVSTRNKLCGIAAYTQALERQLANIFDIRVFDLDQYLLRSQHPRVRPLGDRHIEEICREIADFDAVNLQLEHGTLGRSATDICRRFARLVDAASRLSVTFHTLRRPPIFPRADFVKAIATLKWRTAVEVEIGFARDRKLSVGIARCLRRVQRHKAVSVIVHNRRDLSDAAMSMVSSASSIIRWPSCRRPKAPRSATEQRAAILLSSIRSPPTQCSSGYLALSTITKGLERLFELCIIYQKTITY
jgi:hypothetical protein